MGEIAAGALMKPIGNSKMQLIVSTVVITAFSGAMAAVNQDRRAYGIAVSLSLFSLLVPPRTALTIN